MDMRRVWSICLIFVCAATLALAAPPAPGMELRFDRLASALTLLNPASTTDVGDMQARTCQAARTVMRTVSA